jgi:acetate kinase
MKILVINSGSSSIKFILFQMDTNRMMAKGVVERIGLSNPQLSYETFNGVTVQKDLDVSDIQSAVTHIIFMLQDKDIKVIQSIKEITAVGHRVVHGGEQMTQPVIISHAVKKIIRDCYDLAPLHNPSNLNCIKACENMLPDIPQVAVFDTAFHATIPKYAFLYGLPYRLYLENKIRRYGFHGTSHQYVCKKAAGMMDRPLKSLKIVSCHLGNGSSITAVDGGCSIDTSMGMTPLEGIVMGTRCGDIDPAIIFYLMNNKGMNPEQVHDLLNKQSGLLGLAGIESSDFRDICDAMEKGDPQAKTAIEVYAYRIKKYIGAYSFAMGGLDALVFTAGIGENSSLIRKMACQGLESLGISIDPELNVDYKGRCCEIQIIDTRVKIFVIPANEEEEIALQTHQLLTKIY